MASETGAVVLGARSLGRAGGDIFPRMPALCWRILWGGATEAEIGEMESLCGTDLPALTFLADKAPHLSP